MIGLFVSAKLFTAKLFRKYGCRQGWVISTKPLIIRGQSGTYYRCSGVPVRVSNPPLKRLSTENGELE
jgi:hypothetical protein